MKHTVTAARLLLGLAFFVFGLNGFLGFLPNPPHAGPAGALLGAFAASGYLFPFIKGTELIAGALLLAGVAVPFALVILAPVTLHIVAFHLFLEPATLAPGLVLMALQLYVAWSYRSVYAPLFASSARSTRSASAPAARAPAAA